MSYKLIQVCIGGCGETWCRVVLHPGIQAWLVSPVAAVDVAPEKHANRREHLGLGDERAWTDAGADGFLSTVVLNVVSIDHYDRVPSLN